MLIFCELYSLCLRPTVVRKKTNNNTEFIILLLDHFLVFRLLVFKILYNLSEYHMITQGMHKKKKTTHFLVFLMTKKIIVGFEVCG